MNKLVRSSILVLSLSLALSACRREEPAVTPAVPADGAAAVPNVAPVAPLALTDVVENSDRAIVGISYPTGLDRYPGLAQALDAYSKDARAELDKALAEFGNDKPTAPYELSLSYEKLLETPELVAVAADGSRYTGGAHGEPLVARFVWLPAQNRMLTAQDLIAQPAGWQAISDYVREQLLVGVGLRADADKLEPADRAALLKNSAQMIDEGTEPKPENFDQFVPVLDANKKISALRFVFPPYQVGPYSDGTQTVDVPVVVLRPHLAAAYSGLFAQ